MRFWYTSDGQYPLGTAPGKHATYKKQSALIQKGLGQRDDSCRTRTIRNPSPCRKVFLLSEKMQMQARQLISSEKEEEKT